MSERPVEISETYTPGRNLGGTRRVTVDRIPAIEVTYDGVTDVTTAFGVFERVDELIQRALASNATAEQRITYAAADPCQNECADGDGAYAGSSGDGSSSMKNFTT